MYDREAMLAYGRACAEAARKSTLETLFRLGLVRRWMGVNSLDVSHVKDAVTKSLVPLESTLEAPHEVPVQ